MYFLLENMCFLRIVKISDVFFRKTDDSSPVFRHTLRSVFRPVSHRVFTLPGWSFPTTSTASGIPSRHPGNRPDKSCDADAKDRAKRKSGVAFYRHLNTPRKPLSGVSANNKTHINDRPGNTEQDSHISKRENTFKTKQKVIYYFASFIICFFSFHKIAARTKKKQEDVIYSANNPLLSPQHL